MNLLLARQAVAADGAARILDLLEIIRKALLHELQRAELEVQMVLKMLRE
jgi:hypothetical protein